MFLEQETEALRSQANQEGIHTLANLIPASMIMTRIV
jgi:hypothetical protein